MLLLLLYSNFTAGCGLLWKKKRVTGVQMLRTAGFPRGGAGPVTVPAGVGLQMEAAGPHSRDTR